GTYRIASLPLRCKGGPTRNSGRPEPQPAQPSGPRSPRDGLGSSICAPPTRRAGQKGGNAIESAHDGSSPSWDGDWPLPYPASWAQLALSSAALPRDAKAPAKESENNIESDVGFRQHPRVACVPATRIASPAPDHHQSHVVSEMAESPAPDNVSRLLRR